MEAKHPARCDCCELEIAVGEKIWPSQLQKHGSRWSHFACAEAGGLTAARPPCKHFMRGKCQYGEECFFSHDSSLLSLESEQRRRTWGGKRNVVRKCSRASVLRRLLLDEFGLDFLTSGSGVLDVAGGGGEFSFEMLNINGIESTCIDPRPAGLAESRRKWERGLYWWNPVWKPWNGDRPASGTSYREPRHLRLLFDEDVTGWAEAVMGRKQCSPEALGWLQEKVSAAEQLSWTTKGLHEIENPGEAGDDAIDMADLKLKRPPSFYPEYLHDIKFSQEGVKIEDHPSIAAATTAPGRCGYEAESSVEPPPTATYESVGPPPSELTAEDALGIATTLWNCSTVVGLHPDQAAGHIAEYAVRTGKAFALVPCCVYSSAFPRRKLPNGTPVRSLPHLIEYLVSCAPGARTRTLDFEGRNTVVYWSPKWAEDLLQTTLATA